MKKVDFQNQNQQPTIIVIYHGRLMVANIDIFKKFSKMKLYGQNIQFKHCRQSSLHQGKIGFCLKNWARDMCAVPILSIEADILAEAEIRPHQDQLFERHRRNKVKRATLSTYAQKLKIHIPVRAIKSRARMVIQARGGHIHPNQISNYYCIVLSQGGRVNKD